MLKMFKIGDVERDWVIAHTRNQALALVADQYGDFLEDYLREQEPNVMMEDLDFILKVKFEDDEPVVERTVKQWIEFYGEAMWVCGTAY